MHSTLMLSRGLARDAARRGIPLGRAYREVCRLHPDVPGTFIAFADAYEDERAAMADVPEDLN